MPQQQSNLRERTRQGFGMPSMYHVIMHNDDFTTMDFVVKVLRTVFLKDQAQAEQLMLAVHEKGQAIVGLYTYDIAVSKSQRAMSLAREEGFPFKLTVEADR